MFLMVSVLMIGCQPEKTTQEIRSVSMHITSNPTSIHPYNSILATKSLVLDYAYQYLVVINPQSGEIVPQLLAKLPEIQEDKLTYTYTLHPDAAWPDGSPITSADVLFSLKVLVCPQVKAPGPKAYAEYLADFIPDPEDPKQFSLNMSQYYMHNENFGLFGYILDQRAYDSTQVLAAYSLADLITDTQLAEDPKLTAWAEGFNQIENGTKPSRLQNGSGPYRLVAWENGQELRLEKNPTYWGKGKEGWMHAQDVDEIVFRVIADPQQAELAIQRGELTFSRSLTEASFKRLAGDVTIQERYLTQLERRTSKVFISLNNKADGFKHPAFLRDPLVRRALALSLPLDNILKEDLQSDLIRTGSPVSRGNQLYAEDLPLVPFDPDSAKKLLKLAGWEDSNQDQILDKRIGGRRVDLRFELFHNPKPEIIVELFQLIQQAWAEMGIACEMKPMDQREYRQKHVFTGDYDAALMSLGNNPLPYEFKQIWHSESIQNGYNFMGYDNPKADALIDSIRLNPDIPARIEQARALQLLMLADQPVIHLYVPTARIVAERSPYAGKIGPLPPYIWMSDTND